MKLFEKNSKKLIGKAVSMEKTIIAEVLESFLDKENRMNLDLNGVKISGE